MIYQPTTSPTAEPSVIPAGYVAVMASHGKKLHLIPEKTWKANRILAKAACGHNTHNTKSNGGWIMFNSSDGLAGYEICTRCLEAATKGVGRAVLDCLKQQRQNANEECCWHCGGDNLNAYSYTGVDGAQHIRCMKHGIIS